MILHQCQGSLETRWVPPVSHEDFTDKWKFRIPQETMWKCSKFPWKDTKLSHAWPSITSSHACDTVMEALHGLCHQLSIPVALIDVTMIRITIKLTPSKFVMRKSGGGIICYTEIADYRQEAYTWIMLKGAMPISWVFLLYFNWAAHHFNFTTSLVFSSLYSGLPTEIFHLQMDLPTFPC